ncbi:MAG TPA: endonuclease MutS2 [Candidatus Limnocylindria bacterium]|nr:endonuclease MutS2 [Candidatus Limnocylindria bacterium]
MTRSSRAADPDPSSLRVLEFGAITERLAARTAFAPSRELAEALLPVGDAVHVGLLQDQTDEAVRLLELHPDATIGGARDVRGPLKRAKRGGRLAPAELLDVAGTAHAIEQFRRRLARWPGPQLGAIRDDLEPVPDLREQIERSIDPAGEILDGASSALKSARRRMRVAQERLRERLNAMLRSSDLAGAIGDAIVTQRNGRYVIPVRAEAKGRVPGIVHDQSASAATLFIEPMGVVELNNGWIEATLEAAAEEERILESLSRAVESHADSLATSLAALARADLWMARAHLAAELDAVRPKVSEDALELLSARHPLLGADAVPIDLRLGDRFGYRALVITGPNTGGKTVALKTIGLLALMHQAGLRVPAAGGARLPVFTQVFADIGDEQGIAQSLSTFSSHLRNVVRFLEAAGPHSLVLLDEIGAGTDPTEGSALAMAVVTVLLERGALVAATTHYAELKAFAETQPGVTNAAVEFDVATLRPTYHLSIGLPGASQAFAIAERLGLAPEVLALARERVSSTHASLEETLAAIRRTEAERSKALATAVEERDAARAERDRATTGTERARREAARILAEASRAADSIVLDAEREAAEVRRASGRRAKTPAPDSAAPVAAPRRAKQPLPAELAELTDLAPEPGLQPRVGLWGRSRTLGRSGRIAAVSGKTGRITLESDGARLVVPGADVEVIDEPTAGPPPRDEAADELRRRAAAQLGTSLDLRGERVEDALERLAAYLDQALLAGADEAVIIHGAGTGALRRAIREYLADHPRVRGQRRGRREEGGDGATVAEL